MTAYTSYDQNVAKLEVRLVQQNNNRQRLAIIDQLASHYIYTDIQKAQALLKEQQGILEQYNYPDFKLNFHLNTAIVENQLYNYFLAEIHFVQAVDLLEERGAIKQQAEAYIDYAGTCMNLGKMDAATQLLKKAEKHLQLFPDEYLQARLVCREAYLNLHYSNYARAVELLLTADKQLTDLGSDLNIKDYYFLTLIHSGLGRIYGHNDEREQSIKSYLNVVNMCETMGMHSRLSWHYLNVGIACMSMNDIENAEVYFDKAIKIKDDVSQHARATAYSHLGYCNFQKRNFSKALLLYEKAEHLYKEKSPKDFHSFSILECWKGQLYADLGQRQQAIKHFQTSYAYAEIIDDYRQLSEVCKNFATFYAEQSEFKTAYEYLMEHDRMDELHSDQVNKRQRLELEVKYEAEKKEREAEKLKLEATKLQLKALRAQMNPHFMFNALNSIQHYITSNEVTLAAKYLSKFARLMRRSLEYSEQEIISLEQEIEFLKDYLEVNAKLRFGDRLDYQVSVDDEIEEDIFGVPTMIIQPYVENSIEHGLRPRENGLIKILFELEDDDTVVCIIQDNGVGRKRARELQSKSESYKKHKSMGTAITEKRLEILNVDNADRDFVRIIDLEDPETGDALGTRVEVRIPIIDLQLKQIAQEV